MKFFRKHWSNILFFGLLILVVIPQTRMPIQVFIQRMISFSPSEEDKADRNTIANYNWILTTPTYEEENFSKSKGKVALVNFWATWCPPCVAEIESEVLPTTFVISKAGEIVIAEEGVADWFNKRVKKTITRLLAETH